MKAVFGLFPNWLNAVANRGYTYLVGGLLSKGISPESEQDKLNECGELGWALVSVIVRFEYTVYYFRRERLEGFQDKMPRFDLTLKSI